MYISYDGMCHVMFVLIYLPILSPLDWELFEGKGFLFIALNLWYTVESQAYGSKQ